MSFLFKQEDASTIPSMSENLFKNGNIYRINITMDKHLFERDYEDPFYWRAYIYFKTEDISGDKRIEVEGKNGFAELIRKVEEFISSLK